ncbi:hypothetical protein [Parendozoicomonas sp. Alg238-R29]|uniref:hypothetical protein n=1 Tax=Parendozoicomonas sp. Alg238-R29 TaxID=2993446 RepID=UPI00248D4297|nr:hypothetical protein [Parendozoicomonas sp. Alg238-R29]
MEPSIYQAPESEVVESSEQLYGSVEKGLAGDYDFSVSEILSEAWGKTKGSKLTIHIGYAIAFAVYIGAIAIMVGATFALGDSALFGILTQVLITAIGTPLMVGLFMLGLKRSVMSPISASEPLQYFHKTLPLLGLSIVATVFIMVGFLLLILPGIYLSFAYMFAGPLCAEKNMGVWDSLETSRKAITHRWFSFFGLFLLLGIINLIASIPLGLGLIWTLPMTSIAMGIAYRNMFGVEPQTQG